MRFLEQCIPPEDSHPLNTTCKTFVSSFSNFFQVFYNLDYVIWGIQNLSKISLIAIKEIHKLKRFSTLIRSTPFVPTDSELFNSEPKDIHTFFTLFCR